MKKIKLVSFAMLIAFASFSQTKNYKKRSSLGISFLMKDFPTPALIRATSLSNVVNNGKWTEFSKMTPGLKVGYFEGLNNNIDFTTNLYASFIDYPFKANTAAMAGQDKFLLELDANLNFKLLSDKYICIPYATTGLGTSMFDFKHFSAFYALGFGFQFNLGGETFLHLQYSDHISVTDLHTDNLNYSLGFSSPLKDKEEPKVIIAPPPPAPVVVVEEEKDTDKDGIVDSKDKCPTVPGLAKYNGCPIPDTDKDGINDEEDNCPTVAGTAKYKGCPIPDTDGDGVNDEEDKCPSVAGLARYKGCPIPDTDGDGVNDEEDNCKTTPGPKSNKGCPELAQYNFEAKAIQFATGSTEFTKNATIELDKLETIMAAHKEIKKVSIEGHTDNTGKADKNLALSQKRVDAVKAYLVKKGVEAARLTVVAYGDTKAIGDNKTAAGRAENRRVEFKVGE
jgi:outer membrane protein OmpA-like peptidoglycan-associated protein